MLRLISAIVLCCGSAVVCLPQQLSAQTSTTTANFKPLSKGTIFLYYNSYSSSGWYLERMGPGVYNRKYYNSSGKGYYYSKVVGDTVIAGKRYAIVYSPTQFVDNAGRWGPYYSSDITVFERSTSLGIYQYSQNNDIVVFDTTSRLYSPFMYRFTASDCSSSADSNNITFSCQYVTPFNINSSTTKASRSKSVSFKRGYGLYQQSSSDYVNDHEDGESSDTDQLQFIGAISDGKVLGDSLVLFLNTEYNTFDVMRLSVPLNTSATVGKVVDIPITLSGIKKIIEITGLKTGTVTSTLSFNASMLEPVENTPRGSVVSGLRRIPISFDLNTQSDTSVINFRFRVSVGSDSVTALVLDALHAPNNITIRQKTINGVFRAKGLNDIMMLSIPLNSSALPGQILDIPISLSGFNRFTEVFGLTTNAIISGLYFNASILEPIENTPIGTVSNGVRRIPISFDSNTQRDTSVIKLRFRASVGNVTIATLSLDTLRLPNCIYEQKTQNGVFQVKGLNYAGSSPALFFSHKAAVALSVKPNPVADNLNISFVLDRASAVELVLTSADGRRIASMTSNIPSDGLHEVVWNAKTQDGSAISSGTYFLQLFIDGHCAAETSLIKTR